MKTFEEANNFDVLKRYFSKLCGLNYSRSIRKLF